MSGDWVTGARALVTDDDGRILLLRDGHGDRPALPTVEVEGSWDELSTLSKALAELTGVDAIVVRTIDRSVDEERKRMQLGLELELLQVSNDPRAVWLTLDEVNARPLSAGDRELIERQRTDRPPPERPDWARRGWFAEASAWMEKALAAHGRAIVGPIEQVSNWSISSILRAETEEGRVYLKATARSPLFVDEGTVTRGLAELFPGRVPQPIAVDAERRLMLLDDFGSVVGWKADLETKVAVLTAVARLQLEATSRQGELLDLGVLDRRSAWLTREIESLARSDGLGLEDAEIEELARLTPSLVEAVHRLAAGVVPNSLVHGDLHLSNVAGRNGRYVFFDWTDACLTHPFLDLLVVLFEEDRELQRTLRDAYLSVWAEVMPEKELLELWRLAEPVASVNQAISYRSIMASVERGTAPELASLSAYWLRKALAAIDSRA